MSKWLFLHTYVVPVIIALGLLSAAVLFGMAYESDHEPKLAPTPAKSLTLIRAVYGRNGEHPPQVEFARVPDSDLVFFYIDGDGNRVNMRLVETDSVKARFFDW